MTRPKLTLLQGGGQGATPPGDIPTGTAGYRLIAEEAACVARDARQHGVHTVASQANDVAQEARENATRTSRGYLRTGKRSSRVARTSRSGR